MTIDPEALARDIEAQADRLDDAANEARIEAEARAQQLQEAARALRAEAARVRGGLQGAANDGRISRRMHAQTAERVGPGRPPTQNPGHPVHALSVPMADVAASVGVSRQALQDWITGRRQIPRAKAAALLAAHGIPLSSWPRIRG